MLFGKPDRFLSFDDENENKFTYRYTLKFDTSIDSLKGSTVVVGFEYCKPISKKIKHIFLMYLVLQN